MITLTGFVYHEERPVFLCPLYHPCVDEWEEKSNINKSGWISLLPNSSYISSAASCHLSNTSPSFSPLQSSKEKSINSPTSSQSLSPSSSSSSFSSSSLSSSGSSCSSSFTSVSKKTPTCSPSSSSLTIYSHPNGSGIHFRFEVDRWSLVKYNLTLNQLTFVFKEIWRSKNFRKSIVRKELIPKECRRSIRTLIYRGANIDLFVRFKTDDCQSTSIDWPGLVILISGKFILFY